MRQDEPTARRQVKVRPAGEALESRELMTGNAGSIFAIMPGEVTAPGGTAEVRTTIDATGFTIPRRSLVLGIDVAPASDSTVKPKVQAVAAAGGQTRSVLRSVYSPFVKDDKVVTGAPTSAVLVPLRLNPTGEPSAVNLTTKVVGEQQSSGKFLAGYYLPGDTNDDGKVNRTDIEAIRANLGAVAGQADYRFDADANRNGRVEALDLKIAQQNQGVETTIRPSITANLDPISDSGVRDRTTIYRDVVFQGEAPPGATVTFAEIHNQTPGATTTVGADGKYTLTLALAVGENTFQVTSKDSFGQTISGTIAPVTYRQPLVPVESPKPTPPAQPATPTPATPTTPTDPASARHQLLQQRYPNLFKQMTADQAENLRKRFGRG